jgi:hypothetical protein
LSCGRRSLLLSLELLEVEIKFNTLNDVAIDAAGLTWVGGDAGVKTTRVELIGNLGINLAVLLARLKSSLDGVASLDTLTGLIRFFKLLLVELDVVLLEVPLSEGSGIDQDNGVLNESLGSDELVVGSVVNDIENTAFTTLSTVGFGDFNPKSEVERIVTTFILLVGVATFSYIMGQFIDILMNLQSVTADNEDSENLSKWLGLLAHFNKSSPLPKDMTKRFEHYFEYYWANDKNYAIKRRRAKSGSEAAGSRRSCRRPR